MRTIRDEDTPVGTTRIPDVTAIRATEKALLCVIHGEETWVPQSQIHADSEVYEVGGEGDLIVAQWWAEKNGFE